jgi:aspartate 1-decarboxylase
VQVLNVNTGARFETYAIEGTRGSGVCCLNGPAARQVQPGDIVIVLTYAQMDRNEAKAHRPKNVHVDAKNRITEIVTKPETNGV